MTNIKIIGTPLYQWEIGRRVQIDPHRNMRVDAVHFSNSGDTEALVVKPKEENGKIVADIPNILLQSGKNIVVFSVNIAEDSTETIFDCTFAVRNRAKPADYVYTETEVLTWEALEKRIQALEEGSNDDDDNIGEADVSWYTEGETTFTLTTAEQLFGLAQLVNDGTTTFEGVTIKLGADIVINKGDAAKWDAKTTDLRTWTPIGNAVRVEETKWWFKVHFAGTLDGQGHYISGLYNVQSRDNGFMCYTINATIKNLAIINSYFENDGLTSSKPEDAQVLGGFVARGYGVTLKNLYTDAILVCSGKDYHTGGIVGFAKSNGSQSDKNNPQVTHRYGASTIDSVIFTGTIKSKTGSAGNLLGGILGGTDTSYATIMNSLFDGAINTNDDIVGGIAGRIYGGSEIAGCVSAGIINNEEGKTSGVVAGELNGAGLFTITDCYYSNDQGFELYGRKNNSNAVVTAHGNTALKPVQTAVLRWCSLLGVSP